MANITDYSSFENDLLNIADNGINAGSGSNPLGIRSLDGSGNNAAHIDWGKFNIALIRTTNSYPDITGQDAAVINASIVARVEDITETVMNGNDVVIKNEFNANEFTQFFGQFLTHDITGTVAGGLGSIGSVLGDGSDDPTSANIGRNAGNNTGVRNQLNNETAYLDLGQVYGNGQAELNPDLLWDADTGKLITSSAGLLPTRNDLVAGLDAGEDGSALTSPGPFGPPSPIGVVAGDGRAAQTDQLVSHHTIWLNNHNYHVEQLQTQFAGKSAKWYYEAARALNEAEFQHVVYNEYLPITIGQNNTKAYTGYKSGVNVSILNDFTNVAFRFGHDQSSDALPLLEEDGTVGLSHTLASSFISFFTGAPQAQTQEDQADWIRGQLGLAHDRIDGEVVDGNRGQLFGLPLNLEAFDILRGHDHGNGDYNAVRKSLNLKTYNSWNAFFNDSIIKNDVGRQQELIDVYDNVTNMDAVVGVLLEKKVAGSQMGVTATTLIKNQFANIRDGDRYYFENRFDDDQVNAIKKVTLADIIERTTGVDHVYRSAFIAADRINGNGDGDQDLIVGNGNAQTRSGNGGNDDMYGEGGNDVLNGNTGADWIFGGAGSDTINGGDGNDLLDGGTGSDSIIGGAGHDEVHGGEGDDGLNGGSGDDFLFGGAGEDNIRGEGGNDTMTGGGDNDTFRYTGGRDVITDLSGAGGERVVFQNLAGSPDVVTVDEWEAFLADKAVNADGNDVVISFGGGNTLTLVDFADDLLVV